MAEEATKTIKQFEEKKNVIINDDTSPNKKVTEAEFDELALEHGVGVDFKVRTAYLRKKGIEPTRKNLADSSL